MEFDWSKRTIGEWRDWFAKVDQANWLQSIPFAMAVKVRDQKRTRFALIKVKEEPVGMMAIQEIKLGPVHIVNLYRGPLWFSAPKEEWLVQFAELFAKSFPKRWLRRRRWLPEWHSHGDVHEALKEHGFTPLAGSCFETAWVDLTQKEEDLRSSLKQKWRNALNKSERTDLELQLDTKGQTVNLFLNYYEKDKKLKGYKGREVKFVKAEISAALPFKETFVLWALEDRRPVAAILIFIHGQCASYRIGWTTDVGRKLNAHNLLLWRAMKILKENGLKRFDLGGMEPEKPGGLEHFKLGIGGKKFTSPGMYR